MEYQQREQGATTILEFSGRIDLSTSPGFRRQILKAVKGNRPLLIDLSRVSYIDSSGVACLVEAYQAARGKALRFGLVGITASIMNILKLTRLEQMMPIYDDVESALAGHE